MNAYQLCQRNVVTVRGQEELATAAWMMRERNLGCLVVVEPARGTGGWSPVGFITDRDIVTSVIARNCDPSTVVVEDVMSRAVTVWADSSLEDALLRMREAGVRRLVLVDDTCRMVGILALNDVYKHWSQHASASAGQYGYGQNLNSAAGSGHA